MYFNVFSVAKNDCNNKSNKKTECKYQLSLAKHSLIFLAKIGNCLRIVTNLPFHLTNNNHAKTNQFS